MFQAQNKATSNKQNEMKLHKMYHLPVTKAASNTIHLPYVLCSVMI